MKVFVAVAVIAALSAVLITAASDEDEREGHRRLLEEQIENINRESAKQAKLKITWVEEANKNLSSLQWSSLQEIGKTFHQTFWNITLIAEGKQATDCIVSASNSIIQYLCNATAALNETRETALNSTYTQNWIDRSISYGSTVIYHFNYYLDNLDCLVYQPHPSDFCYDIKESYYEWDLDMRYFYDNIDITKDLIERDTTSAYSTASEANAKTIETAHEQAKSVEDTAAECIASL